jgi:hypothetical protein
MNDDEDEFQTQAARDDRSYAPAPFQTTHWELLVIWELLVASCWLLVARPTSN